MHFSNHALLTTLSAAAPARSFERAGRMSDPTRPHAAMGGPAGVQDPCVASWPGLAVWYGQREHGPELLFDRRPCPHVQVLVVSCSGEVMPPVHAEDVCQQPPSTQRVLNTVMGVSIPRITRELAAESATERNNAVCALLDLKKVQVAAWCHACANQQLYICYTAARCRDQR
jgi:hypothetical protein